MRAEVADREEFTVDIEERQLGAIAKLDGRALSAGKLFDPAYGDVTTFGKGFIEFVRVFTRHTKGS